MHCGWLPRSVWPEGDADLPPCEIGGEVVIPEVCPGWLQRQPLVGEVAQAWRAFDKGQLGEVFPDAPNVIIEGVFALDAAISKHQADAREAAKKTHG